MLDCPIVIRSKDIVVLMVIFLSVHRAIRLMGADDSA